LFMASMVARFSHCASRCSVATLSPSIATASGLVGTGTVSGASGRWSGRLTLDSRETDRDLRSRLKCSRDESLRSPFPFGLSWFESSAFSDIAVSPASLVDGARNPR
jgi:hypothetical protein